MHTIFRRTAGVLLPLTFAITTASCTLEVKEDEGTGLEASVTAMLERSAEAWSNGDLDAFMSEYANSTTTSFMTADGPVYGPERIKAGYEPSFAVGAQRDSLRFEDLSVRQLPPLIGIATARYVLHRDGQVTATGWFTLILRRMGSGWRIVHDHSSPSSLPEEPHQPELVE